MHYQLMLPKQRCGPDSRAQLPSERWDGDCASGSSYGNLRSPLFGQSDGGPKRTLPATGGCHVVGYSSSQSVIWHN
jgi:hypothetical protein